MIIALVLLAMVADDRSRGIDRRVVDAVHNTFVALSYSRGVYVGTRLCKSLRDEKCSMIFRVN